MIHLILFPPTKLIFAITFSKVCLQMTLFATVLHLKMYHTTKLGRLCEFSAIS